MILFYGLYFGVVGRDFSETCTDVMAASIGVSHFLPSSLAVDVIRVVLESCLMFAARPTLCVMKQLKFV